MIKDTYGFKMLTGVRGQAKGDIKALVKTIDRVSSMAMSPGAPV